MSCIGEIRHFAHPSRAGRLTIAGPEDGDIPSRTAASLINQAGSPGRVFAGNCSIAVIRPEVQVIIEEENGSWGAYAPAIPGCVAAGGSRREVQQCIQRALTAHLGLLHEDAFRAEAIAGANAGNATSAD